MVNVLWSIFYINIDFIPGEYNHAFLGFDSWEYIDHVMYFPNGP